MNRDELLMSLIDVSGLGLEIGPSFSPLLPKAKGYRIETLDHLTAEKLREKYGDNISVDISKIEEVDYVSDGGSIAELIGKPGRFDYIVASHVIEHTTDMLGFLIDCSTLLNDHGVLALAVPDKRFCFDVFRPPSTTGDILQAHLEKRKRHNPGTVFDEVAYSALRKDAPGWSESDSGTFKMFHLLEKAKHLFEEVQQTGAFIDVHAWQFTPSSFRLIVSDLAEISYTTLREKFFRDTIGFEFFVALSKTGAGCPISRVLLAEKAIAEQKKIKTESAG
jgi:SAM-dependent methyltransferase